MAHEDRNDDDALTSSDVQADEGDLTPPHGDEVLPNRDGAVNAERDVSESRLPPSSSRR